MSCLKPGFVFPLHSFQLTQHGEQVTKRITTKKKYRKMSRKLRKRTSILTAPHMLINVPQLPTPVPEITMMVDIWPLLTISITSSAPRLEAQINMDKIRIFGFGHDANQVGAQFLWPFSMILTVHSMQALMSTCENLVV